MERARGRRSKIARRAHEYSRVARDRSEDGGKGAGDAADLYYARSDASASRADRRAEIGGDEGGSAEHRVANRPGRPIALALEREMRPAHATLIYGPPERRRRRAPAPRRERP